MQPAWQSHWAWAKSARSAKASGVQNTDLGRRPLQKQDGGVKPSLQGNPRTERAFRRVGVAEIFIGLIGYRNEGPWGDLTGWRGAG